MVYLPLWNALQKTGKKKNNLVNLSGEGPRSVAYAINDNSGRSMTVKRAKKYANCLGCTVEELLPDFRRNNHEPTKN